MEVLADQQGKHQGAQRLVHSMKANQPLRIGKRRFDGVAESGHAGGFRSQESFGSAGGGSAPNSEFGIQYGQVSGRRNQPGGGNSSVIMIATLREDSSLTNLAGLAAAGVCAIPACAGTGGGDANSGAGGYGSPAV